MAMTLRLTDEDQRILDDLSAQQGMSKQQVTLWALREAHKRHAHKQAVANATDQALNRWGDVIKRLGE